MFGLVPTDPLGGKTPTTTRPSVPVMVVLAEEELAPEALDKAAELAVLGFVPDSPAPEAAPTDVAEVDELCPALF